MPTKRIFLLLFFVGLIVHFTSNETFTQEKWHQYPNRQHKMADDLVKSGVLLGKDKTFVRKLLGANCKLCTDNNDTWMYYTKVSKGWLNPDIEVLDIEFKDGLVVEAVVRE